MQPFRWRCFLLDIVPKEMVTYHRYVSYAKIIIIIIIVIKKKTNEDRDDELDNVKTDGEQSHDEVYGCLKGGSRNSGGKILAISMVEEAWLTEKEEV
ncbi:hypothetical protein Tco_1278998 [Tanacetum coccineum]